MNFRFPKSARLLTRNQFQRMQHHNHRFIGRWIVIESRKSNRSQQLTRLGITVTRRYGKSHDRNRFKRVVREAYRHLQFKIVKGIDLVVRPKESYSPLGLSEIKQDMLNWIETTL